MARLTDKEKYYVIKRTDHAVRRHFGGDGIYSPAISEGEIGYHRRTLLLADDPDPSAILALAKSLQILACQKKP